MVEGARLLSECVGLNPHRGSESRSLRLPPFYLLFAPMAQLDRAVDYGSTGWGFESLWAHWHNQKSHFESDRNH